MSRRTVLVSGGSSGIGLAIVDALVTDGCRVGVISRNRADRIKDERAGVAGSVEVISADLRDERQTRTAIEGWGKQSSWAIDGLVLSAVSYGHGGRHDVTETTLDEWEQIMSVNLRAQFVIVATLLPYLLARPRAFILSLSSSAALEAAPGRATYAASKAGALAFFRALAEELRDTSVSVVQAMPKNQVVTPGLKARRPPGFAFEGYDPPEIFAPLTRRMTAEMGAGFNGAVMAIDASGGWQHAALPRARERLKAH